MVNIDDGKCRSRISSQLLFRFKKRKIGDSVLLGAAMWRVASFLDDDLEFIFNDDDF